MLIVETPIFTKRLRQVLDDEQYRLLQISLIASPEAGQVIRGGGGLRKLVWSGSGRGKRGGARIIYRWFPEHDRLLMLFIFLKNEREELADPAVEAAPYPRGERIDMKKEVFEELLESVRQGGEIMRGKRKPSRVFVAADPDARKIRELYGLSQERFASLIGISVATLRNWEQGRRQPEGPAKVLLRVAAKHPEAVLDVVSERKTQKTA